jgi:hypothetical protein
VSAPRFTQSDFPREVWRNVPGFPGYRVSSHGNFRLKCGRVLRADESKRTHRPLTLQGPDGPRCSSVHREVLRAFDREPLAGEESCHFPDKNPQNCAIWNLRWDSRLGNGRDRRIHERIHGERDAAIADAELARIHAERMARIAARSADNTNTQLPAAQEPVAV